MFSCTCFIWWDKEPVTLKKKYQGCQMLVMKNNNTNETERCCYLKVVSVDKRQLKTKHEMRGKFISVILLCLNSLNLRLNRTLFQSLSRAWLFSTPWTVVPQDPCVHGFPRQKYWSELSCLLQGIFPTQGSKSSLLLGKWIFYHYTIWDALWIYC